ncbi:tRNA 5-methoxyuridine(34)/uridine 5-oxyacetic acid(34) synthase CmoB [Marinobacteraceae bacterium S3BR75-40.1]
MPANNAFDWNTTFSPLLERLRHDGQSAWAEQLQAQLHRRFVERPHGDVPRWHGALKKLPDVAHSHLEADQPTVSITAPTVDPATRAQAEEALRGLMPWRKGPFRFFDVFVDTEWRSDWKWSRVAPHISDLKGRRILDVGCGSGYHCWRMWAAGAREVIGIDPGLLFLMQFLAVKRYAGDVPVDLLPVRMEDLPPRLAYFDTTFSMGILYHRRSPIDHLLELQDTLKPGGELVLETLVIEGPEGTTLMPEDRYGKMRNVWFIPSCPTLERWLQRAGFEDIRTVDVTRTTVEEQRATDWMRFQSLPDFLDPADAHKTVEGYPGPMRATLVARKPD